MSIESPWLTAPEAATYSRRHINTINLALRSGELKGQQPSGKRLGRWLIHRDDIDAWIRGEVAEARPTPVVARRSKAS